MYNNPWANHAEQVQFNAFIVRNATGFTRAGREGVNEKQWNVLPFDPRKDVTKELALVYLGPKFPKVLMVERTTDYFDFVKGKEVRGKQPYIMSDEDVLKVLEPRVAMFKKALEVYPEWPEGAEELWGGEPGYTCPGTPLCKLPNCLAKRWSDDPKKRRLVW